MSFYLPITVNSRSKKEFISNLKILTFEGKHTILFAADQRIEHGPASFVGKGISKDDISAEHFFNVAKRSKISALATHYGLLSKYGLDYPQVNYVVKLNSITSLVKENAGYTQSKSLVSVNDVIELKRRGNLNIVGVGYTVYLGVPDETTILKEASKIIMSAHEHGLPVILWIYPKPKKGKEDSFDNVGHACMVGEALGADFIKVKPPVKASIKQEDLIKLCVKLAGRSKILISGGSSLPKDRFLSNAYKYVYKGNAFGVAVGRNIHQKPLHEAVQFLDDLYFTIVQGNMRLSKEQRAGVQSII